MLTFQITDRNMTEKVHTTAPIVLIVEDETLLAWSLANSLRRSGYEVAIADTGEKAIHMLNSMAIGAVITDVKLPYINGFDVTSAVKDKSPLIPVIIISAVDDEIARKRMLESRADRFFEKPFDLADISREISSLLLHSSPVTRS